MIYWKSHKTITTRERKITVFHWTFLISESAFLISESTFLISESAFLHINISDRIVPIFTKIAQRRTELKSKHRCWGKGLASSISSQYGALLKPQNLSQTSAPLSRILLLSLSFTLFSPSYCH